MHKGIKNKPYHPPKFRSNPDLKPGEERKDDGQLTKRRLMTLQDLIEDNKKIADAMRPEDKVKDWHDAIYRGNLFTTIFAFTSWQPFLCWSLTSQDKWVRCLEAQVLAFGRSDDVVQTIEPQRRMLMIQQVFKLMNRREYYAVRVVNKTRCLCRSVYSPPTPIKNLDNLVNRLLNPKDYLHSAVQCLLMQKYLRRYAAK